MRWLPAMKAGRLTPKSGPKGARTLENFKEHNKRVRAFESFPKDADKLFPNWRQALRINSAA